MTKEKPDKFIPDEMFQQLFDKLYELKKLKVKMLKERQVELKRLDTKYTRNIDQIEKDIYKMEDGITRMSSKKDFVDMRNKYEIAHGIKEDEQKPVEPEQ